VVVGNAMSRGNPELEYVLDERIPFCSLPQICTMKFLRGKEVIVVAGTHGKTTNHLDAVMDFHSGGEAAFVFDWRYRGKFRIELRARQRGTLHPRRDEYDTAFLR